MSDTNRRIDNGKSVPDKSVGTLAARNATIGNLVVTGTTTTAGNSAAVQFSNMTVTGTLGAGAVNATTSSIGNLTVTGTFVNANATTSQFAAVSVTGNASVGGNVVVGGDGIFCGATSGVTTLATTQYTSNVGLLYTTGTGLNTPANIISTGIITMTNNTSNQFGFVDYTTPTLAPGTPFRIGFDYLYAGAADGFCAQLWFSNNAPTTAIGSNADRSVTNAAIGYRFGYDIFSNKTAGFYQNANVSSGASVSLAKSASALPGNSWCTYTWTFDGASVWTTQVSNAANTAQMYMANVVVDPLALGIWTGATYPNTLRMYGASGGQTALQQIRNVTVSTTTLGNVRGIGCGFVGAANVSTGAYVASSTGTGSAPIVGNTYVSFVGNGTANGGYLDAGPQTFTRFSTGATAMAYVAFTAPNVETQRYEAICSFGNGTGANTFRLNRNGNASTTIMYVSDSVGNTCVAGAGGNIVPYVPSVWTGVFTPPTTCTMYQNATMVNTNTNPGTIMSLAPSVVMPHTYVGKSQFADPYASMNLYGFVYWNASLTPAQITQAYTYLTAGTGSLPRPEAISAPLTILPTAPNALVGKSAYVPNVTAQNGNVTATNANASSVGVTNSVTIAGNVSTTDINARGNVAVSKNVVVTGNVSATDVNATGNLAVTKFATVTGGINLPGNAAAAFGTPGNAAVVLTTASFANVLSYANTYDTLANIAATGNLILTNNTANQVQSVTYVVPGLAPGVAFSANVGFTSSSYQSTSNNSGDAYAIQFFPSDIGTLPLCTGTVDFDGNGNLNGFGYTFGYIYGNVAASIASKYGWYYYSSTGARTVYNQTFNPVLAINSTYNFFVGFDGVQTWTYKVSNSTTVIASGTATDPAALYNMSMALYPTTVRIRANSNAGISLITANAVSIVANVGVGYASATANASGFIVANSNNATMMTIKSASPYVATLGSVIANVAATVGPGSLNVFGPTYFGNSTTITGPTTVSGPSTFSGATTFYAPVTVGYVNSYSNIVPNATSGIVWAGGTPNAMIESYYASTDRYGFGVFGNVMRIYTSSAFGGAVVCLGKYSTTGTTVSTDWVYGNSSGVYMTSNVSVASNVSSSTGNVILAAQTIRVTGVDLGNNSVLVLNASGGTQNNMINLTGNAIGATTDTYGFGLASGTLRYNATTGGKHSFYSNTFTCATIQTSGTAIAGNANSEALTVTNSYGTGFTGNAVTLATTTAAGAGFNMLMATANGVKQFRVAGNGATYANGPYSSAGADYAEYFEWADGNPGAEDRRGLTVVLDGGDKIRIATISDASTDVIGVVSAVPTTIGDSAWSRWQGMYVTDAFGCPTTELNPAYDPDAEYVPRSERKEWAPIGLIGKLRVLTGRPVGSSWIRMKTDITPGVDLWLVRRPRL